MNIFIRNGMIVHHRALAMPKGLAVVVGKASDTGQVRICRWRGGTQHWGLPRLARLEQLEAVEDWTSMPLTEAKRLAAAAFERDYLVHVVASANGSVLDAARLARIDRSNFRRLLQRHGLVSAPRRAKAPQRTKRRRRRNK